MRPPDALHAHHPVVKKLCRELLQQFAVPESFKLSTLKLKIELTKLVIISVPERKKEWLQNKQLKMKKNQKLQL